MGSAQLETSGNRDPRSFAIIGAAMEVHRHLGCGFLEAVYGEALTWEFTERAVPFRREVDLPVFYKGHQLNTTYRADFVCFNSIIVELKALAKLGGIEEAQIINYLKSARYETGLLLNFGAPSLDYRRFIFSKHHPQITQMAQIEKLERP
jgi:GxxExxY protein